jgi:hypothetical protein
MGEYINNRNISFSSVSALQTDGRAKLAQAKLSPAFPASPQFRSSLRCARFIVALTRPISRSILPSLASKERDHGTMTE